MDESDFFLEPDSGQVPKKKPRIEDYLPEDFDQIDRHRMIDDLPASLRASLSWDSINEHLDKIKAPFSEADRIRQMMNGIQDHGVGELGLAPQLIESLRSPLHLPDFSATNELAQIYTWHAEEMRKANDLAEGIARKAMNEYESQLRVIKDIEEQNRLVAEIYSHFRNPYSAKLDEWLDLAAKSPNSITSPALFGLTDDYANVSQVVGDFSRMPERVLSSVLELNQAESVKDIFGRIDSDLSNRFAASINSMLENQQAESKHLFEATQRILEVFDQYENKLSFLEDSISLLHLRMDDIKQSIDGLNSLDLLGVDKQTILAKLLGSAPGDLKAVLLSLIANFIYDLLKIYLSLHLIFSLIEDGGIKTIAPNEEPSPHFLSSPKSPLAEPASVLDLREVTAQILILRSKPTSKSKKLAKLPFGTTIRVLSKKGKWLKVRVVIDESELDGWVHSRYLKDIDARLFEEK